MGVVVGRVRKVSERRSTLRIFHDRGPLATVGVDELLHVALELAGEAETVVYDHVAHVLDAALELLDPDRRARQSIGGSDVVHQDASSSSSFTPAWRVPKISSSGLTGSSLCERAKVLSVAYSLASPTKMPPRSRFASSLTTRRL